MTRMVVTHAVKDVDLWLASRARFVEAFAPYATDLCLYTIPDGGNNVAISMNVHDMEGVWALTETPEHKAMVEEAGIIHPPHAMYMEAAG